jgi:4-hydroxy-3-methylbut-2-enyl diphosphate reductase
MLQARGARLTIHNTICGQVSSRHEKLIQFAQNHDIIIFVTGKESSNGKILSALCRNVNPRTYVIGRIKEIDSAWFRDGDRVGVCGATSTPKWALEAVAHNIENL